MVWNITAECFSVVILCILWVYSRQGNFLPTLKNKLFQVCFLVTFIAISSNIASTLMLYHYQDVPMFLSWLVTTVYFVTTPLMGVVYFWYAFSIVFEGHPRFWRLLLLSSVPAAAYLALILLNPLTHWIFDISPTDGYVRGKALAVTYVIFYLYCFSCLVISLLWGKHLERSIRNILASFPIVAGITIVVQQLFPEYILSGSAATCALLIIYLYLQNKQISLDHLTGLPNRQSFLKMLELRMERHQSEPFTVLVLSLKNFKTVNDNFGQHNGNLMLRAVAEYLRTAARRSLIYRYSGDEFAILPGRPAERDTDDLIGAVSRRMTLPWEAGTCSTLLSCGLAVVQYPSSAVNVEGLVDGIESTVAEAKKNAHQSCCYCTQEMLDQLRRRSRVIDILKQRLVADSFEVYYQPILSLDSMKFNKAEALLRLNDTPIGPISPSEFIPIAEDTGLITGITYQVLAKVCAFLRRQLDEGKEVDTISVNFSSKQFLQEDIAQRVFDIIEASGAPFSHLKIEITESTLMENFEAVSSFLGEIHSRGVRFALDDFGVGYSNISTVLGFPISTVKLDKSLVWSSVNNRKSEAVVRHMIAAFKEVGIDILAEGVENERQRDFIMECGCDMIQGFLYAKPMPPGDAAAFLGNSPEDAPHIEENLYEKIF